MVGVVAGWLAGAAVGDAYSRAINGLKPDEVKRLRKRVERHTRIAFPAGRYDAWYERDETWGDLCQRTPEAYDSLRASLHDSLWGRPRLFRRSPPLAQQEKVTDSLLEATIGRFMQNLDPSTAVAVHDARDEHRHQELLSRIEGAERVDERLLTLPFAAREELKALRGRDDSNLFRVLDFMEQGMERPAAALHGLLEPAVPWLDELPTTALVALAEYAAAYGQAPESATLFELAAATGSRRGWSLARAALQAAGTGQADRARELSGRAKEVDPDDGLVRVLDAAIAGDPDALLSELGGADLTGDPIRQGLLAAALARTDRLDEAIDLLRGSANSNPEWTGVDLLCSQMLTDRAATGRSHNRESDLREAVQRAVRCRDERRRWGGLSSQAVAAACRAAAVNLDHELVIRLSSAPPSGEARQSEADDLEVVGFSARSRLGTGDIDGALELARKSQDRYLLATVSAKACLMRGPDAYEEGRRHAEEAWVHATDENDKVDILVTSSLLGIEQLPGDSEVDRLEPELADLIRAQSAQARGDSPEAIALLRRHVGRSEECAAALAHIYSLQGRTDEAVAELEHAADRFQRPQLLISAAIGLLRAGRGGEARAKIHVALTRMPPANPARLHAHEILLQIAQDERDWHEMEVQARAILTETGDSSQHRWVLVGALYNQGKHQEAWQACDSDGGLKPMDAQTAALWARLHCQFNPSPATLPRLTELLEEYMEHEETAAAIAMSVLMMDAAEAPEENVMARWHAAFTAFVDRYPDTGHLRQIRLGDNFEELSEYLRETIGRSHDQAAEAQAKVAAGALPQGMLAAFSGRPYTATVLRLDAGCLPMYPGDRSAADVEREAAKAHLGRSVVVDPTTLVVASFTEGLWERLQGEFQALSITEAALIDVVAAREHNARGDGMTLSWDPVQGPVVFTVEADVMAERRRRSEDCEDRARRDMRELTWASQQAFGDQGPDGQPFDEDPRFWSWISGLDYAKANDVAFLCDDVALRQLARSEGVPTFGSAAFVEVLEAEGRLSSAERRAIFDQWRSERCVDLPDPDELLAYAGNVGFEPALAALTLSRPAFWQDAPAALQCFRTITAGVANEAPDKLPHWLYAGILGACTGREGLPPDRLTHP